MHRLLCCLLLALLATPASADRPPYQVDDLQRATLVLGNQSWTTLRAGLAAPGKLFVGAGPLQLPRGGKVYLALPPGRYRLLTPTGPRGLGFRIRRTGKTLLDWAGPREFALAEGVAPLLAGAGLDLARCGHLDRRTTTECAKKLYLMRPDRLEIFEGASRSVYPRGGSALARLAARPRLAPAEVIVVTPPPITVINQVLPPPAIQVVELIQAPPVVHAPHVHHAQHHGHHGLAPRHAELFGAIRAARRLTPRH